MPLAVLAAALGAITVTTGPSPAAPDAERRAATEVGLFAGGAPRAQVVVRRGPAREVGMRFTAKVAGSAVGLRYYKPMRWRSATPRTATLWTGRGEQLARARVRPVTGTGWRKVTFDAPVTLSAGRRYVVSVHTRGKGIHAASSGAFRTPKANAHLRAPADRNGLTTAAGGAGFPDREAARDTNYWVDVRFVPAGDTQDPTTTPTPTPTTVPTSWPGPDNTGVPAGTNLTPYNGPCTITSPRTISAVDATGSCDALLIHTTGVVIEKSLVPRIQSIYQDGGSSVTVTDSDVRGGDTSTGALWGYNITARRVDVTGGQHSFHCNENCEVTESWLHDQYNPDGGSYHNNAFISNGGSNMVIRGNTLHCTAVLNRTDGGCTADVSLFGDFGPIDNVTVDGNFLRANSSSISYCAYGGASTSKPYQATNVRFTNNVFERGTNRKCGVYGPITSFDRRAAGNVWSGNVWDAGGAVNPA
ncbi:DUF4082 domain-containing protein [Nocardioides sp. S-58]|uniref:DUF4082 domain-containing protein n=1 Tax=Nocardioides renjunii TaxID=3095075 RepID=A0ABU5K7F7_9ACTN|nr:DUF4082 domain-containing protein [Nocardioides sp. S-58]MDZ5660545.1 DUF4082 domain-containing protein [Nocardioides sp. S-58]